MSQAHSHFQAASGSPRPLQIDGLFRSATAAYSYNSNSSALLQQLVQQVEDQGSILSELIGAGTGQSGGSAISSVLGGASFGGSALGGIASAAQSGFSWQSILKDVFPIGGLISGIAGLFSSAAVPPPLDQYDAPPALNFDAVLNGNGTLSQGSSDQYGHTRASGQGLDLTDAQGGPYSPYQRAPNGSLVPVAGDPTTRYSGSLNLLGAANPASPSNLPNLPGALNVPDLLQSVVSSAAATTDATPTSATQAPGSVHGSFSPVSTSNATPAAAPGNSQGLGSTGSSLTADPSEPAPSFDQQWFNDHGSLIASAVRAQLLNFHPIVDTINDL